MKNRAVLIILAGAAALAIYSLASLAETSAGREELRARERSLTAEAESLERENAALAERMKPENEAKLYEDTARDRLGLVYPDEIIFIDVGG